MPHAIVADLHCHSTASDGTDAPARVSERAHEVGLEFYALTDHDTVAGIDEARARARDLGLGFVAGAELTCYVGSREVHLIALGLDTRNEDLLMHCEAVRRSRLDRAHEIARRLAAAGAPIDIDAAIASADAGNVGRPHIAQALLNAGHVASWDEAFDRFLGDGKPAAVPKLIIDPARAIGVAHGAGGRVFFAHPGIGNQFDLIEPFARLGLDGVEIIHSNHDAQATDRATGEAIRLGLLKSGGSDCHGDLAGKLPILGQWGLDRSRWEALKPKLRIEA